MNNIIEFVGISKKFNDHSLFKDYSISIEANKLTAIVGKSGSGKTTLLNMIGFLEPIDSGDYYFDKQKNIKPYSKKARLLYKNRIGFLFQSFALIEHESVIYNLSTVLNQFSKKERLQKMEKVLEDLGILYLKNAHVSSCSGGEKQRIALARLILQDVDVILADEPTGSLDNQTKWEVFNLIKGLLKLNKTIIIVTHDEELQKQCDKVIDLSH